MQGVAYQQTWSTQIHGKNARFVSNRGADVLALLAPLAGERIVDVGCRDGALGERAAPALRDGGGRWTADDVRLRFLAHRR